MKTKRFFAAILSMALCVNFVSCGDDDKEEPMTGISQIIVGEWDSELMGDVSDIDTEELDVNDTHLDWVDSRLVFNSNGKGYEVDQENGIKTEFSYKIDGNILQMTGGNMTQRHKIIKSSNNVVYSLMESEQSIFKMVRRK